MKQRTITTEIDKDVKIIPFNEVMRLAEALPIHKRLAILFLAITGARPSEIEYRKVSEIQYGCFIWKPRKRQKGTARVVKLPKWYLNELEEYLKNGKYADDDIFGVTADTLARYINGKVREQLGGLWLQMKPEFSNGDIKRWVYSYQLKNLRHNYVTVEWYRESEKYGHELALHRVSRHMKHSSIGMTADHYIEDVEVLNLKEYKNLTIGEILQKFKQRTLSEFI